MISNGNAMETDYRRNRPLRIRPLLSNHKRAKHTGLDCGTNLRIPYANSGIEFCKLRAGVNWRAVVTDTIRRIRQDQSDPVLFGQSVELGRNPLHHPFLLHSQVYGKSCLKMNGLEKEPRPSYWFNRSRVYSLAFNILSFGLWGNSFSFNLLSDWAILHYAFFNYSRGVGRDRTLDLRGLEF